MINRTLWDLEYSACVIVMCC